MAETDTHRDLMVYFIEALKVRYADRSDVYVSGNNFIYYQEGDPGRRVSPDTYAVFGVEMRQRNSYKVWEEGGKLPDVVFEFTSRKTRREDTDMKRPLYEQVLRVPEYILFDPTGDYLRPRLQGYRLAGGAYVALEPVEGRLRSEKLGLDLVVEGNDLRLYDPGTREKLLTPAEQARAATEQARRVEAVEAENARLRAEVEALRNVGGD